MNEYNIIVEILSLQFRHLTNLNEYECHLVDGRPVNIAMLQMVIDNFGTGVRNVYTSRESCTSNGMRSFVRDVIVAEHDVGQVAFHLNVDGTCWTCICVWEPLHAANTYRITNARGMILTDSIKHVCIYRLENEVAYVVPPNGFE